MASDSDISIAQDLRDFDAMATLPSLLSVVCDVTGLGFAAVARVTDRRWVALAVHDTIAFGVRGGQELDLDTTLCNQMRATGTAVAFDDATTDPVYSLHPTPRLYQFRSYVGAPIILKSGRYFGTLFALDREPRTVTRPHILELLKLLARLIASQLEGSRDLEKAELDVVWERENSALREQFIGVMGHDLRNPLAGIVANVGLLRFLSHDPRRIVDVANRLEGSAKRMSLLIDDVVDMVRGRLGKGMVLTLERVDDLSETLEQVVDELRDANPQRPFEVTINTPVPVVCDKVRVQQLLSNLVANAIEHGADGSPVVVRVAPREGALAIVVSNQGTLIAPEALGLIFDAFTRGESCGDGRSLGLGLFICKQVAKAHGGTISAMSTADEGTIFTALLPVNGPQGQ